MQYSSRGWVFAVVVVVVLALIVAFTKGPAPQGNENTATSTPETATTTGASTSVIKESTSVAGIVASLPAASTFRSYLSSTGVSGSLSGKGPYTVFVPTDQAFAALQPGTISSLSAAGKKRLVQYHIISGKALDIDAVSNGMYTALSKDPLNFRVDLTYKEAFVDSAYAIEEHKASNGIVYVISAVLMPPMTGAATTPHP